MPLKTIIGLGNPGSQYASTRHNVGFMVVDELARRWNLSFRAGKGRYVMAKDIAKNAILVKPTTYMNLSGEAVQHVTDYFHIDTFNCMLVFDELDIPFPQVRIRKQGGGGTHRGVQSVIYQLKDDTFPRIRMGIGGNQGRKPSEAFVLESYSKDEINDLTEQIQKAADATEYWIKSDDIDNTMNRFNRKPKTTVEITEEK
jgi:PTH1 family peptidyl-tRNA hydrolase